MGWVGVIFAQHAIYDAPDTVRVAEHIIVPESNEPVSFRLDESGSFCVDNFRMLSTVDLNDELGSVAGEISNVMADGRLPPEMLMRKAFPKDAPEHLLRIGHVSTKSASALDGAVGRMMLHSLRSTMNDTPPQPLPIKGRG